MKRILLLLLLFSPLLSFSQTQVKTYEGIIRVHVNEATIKANQTASIDLDVTLCNLDIRSRQRLELTPVLFYESDTLHLAPIIVNGNIRQQNYWRNMRLHGKDADESHAFTVLRNEKKKIITVPYFATVPVNEWLPKAGLRLEGKYISSSNKCELSTSEVLAKELF